jgi:hypothetical protein
MNDDFDPFTGENCKKICPWKWIVQCLLGEEDSSTIGRIGHQSGRGLF